MISLGHMVPLATGEKIDRSTCRFTFLLRGSVRLLSVKALTRIVTEKAPGWLGTTTALAMPRSMPARRENSVNNMAERVLRKK